MSYFEQLYDLPVLDLNQELEKLESNGVIKWHPNDNQICLNTMIGHETDYLLGSGSLVWDWSRARMENGKIVDCPRFEPERKNETDFTELCTQFHGTMFEEVYSALKTKYHLGRVRLMKSNPKTCLSWHIDEYPRVHYPIFTHNGCFMVIEDQVKYLPKYTWWYTNTLLKHTAFNGSGCERVHLVATIIGEK
jgi:hypothetical protein